MTEQTVIARGWSLPIFQAIRDAGGFLKVAHAFGYRSMQTPENWVRTGRMPAAHVKELCRMAGRQKHDAKVIFDDMKQREQIGRGSQNEKI